MDCWVRVRVDCWVLFGTVIAGCTSGSLGCFITRLRGPACREQVLPP